MISKVEEATNAIKVSIEWFTKAIPKKVKRDTYQKGLLSEMNIFRCPSCDNQDTIWDITGDGMNYCGECGQKLNWEGWNNV
jgi:transcription elongation factor Elf1